LDSIVKTVRDQGYAFVPGHATRALLSREALVAWPEFAGSWDDLQDDTFMADEGRYRKRRYAVFNIDSGTIERLLHRPHYQSRLHNQLNGGADRWFAPVTREFVDNPLTHAILMMCQDVFSRAGFGDACGMHRAELHQFRIEADREVGGRPTPEGVHRDGVDWACALMVGRTNVDGGVTHIENDRGVLLDTCTLHKPLDALFLNDHRVLHGVTPISRSNAAQVGFRDVLVVTLRAMSRSMCEA